MYVAQFAAMDKHALPGCEPLIPNQTDPVIDIAHSHPSIPVQILHETHHNEMDLPPHIARAIQRIMTSRSGVFATLISAGQRQLLVEIIRCTSWKQPAKGIIIANQTLAWRMDVSIATIKRGLKLLEEFGWITREQLRSQQNKFLHAITTLSADAIRELGIDKPLKSLFFRGSEVSSTIGNLVIQSSSKRQQSQQAAPGVDDQHQNRLNPSQSASNDAQAQTVDQKDEDNVQKNPVDQTQPFVRVTGPKGNVISLPAVLTPLLKLKLKPQQICRLMSQARRAGHLLEDITTTCQAQIAAAHTPMAYIQRLIACERDWSWIRKLALQKASELIADAQTVQTVKAKKQRHDEFLQTHNDKHLVNSASTSLYVISDMTCRKYWRENDLSKSAIYPMSDEFIDAVGSGKLKEIDPKASQKWIQDWNLPSSKPKPELRIIQSKRLRSAPAFNNLMAMLPT